MTAATPTALTHEIGASGRLSIRSRDGSVRLRAVDGTTVRIHDGDPDGPEIRLAKGEGSLGVETDVDGVPGAPRGRSRHLLVEVPTRATVVVESASGDIAVDGLLGDQRYRTASGDITLRDVAGRLGIDAVSGDVEATVVDHVVLSARTVSGDLALRAATIESLRASTTSGDLRIAGRLAPDGPFAIETVSGDVLLALLGDVRVEMRSITGDLRSEVGGLADGGRGRRSITVGTGRPTLVVRSTSGDVRLVRAMAVAEPTLAAAASPEPPEPPAAAPADDATVAHALVAPDDPAEADRLAILRALERGDIDVEEATRRLDALDGTEATPDPGVVTDPDVTVENEETTDGE